MKNKGQIQDGKYYYKYWSLLIFLLIPVLLLARYYFAGQVPGDADLIQFFSNKKAFAEALMSGEFHNGIRIFKMEFHNPREAVCIF